MCSTVIRKRSELIRRAIFLRFIVRDRLFEIESLVSWMYGRCMQEEVHIDKIMLT